MKNAASAEERKTARRISIPVLAVVAVLFVLFSLTGNIRTSVEADRVVLDGDYWPDRTVLLKDVTGVKLVRDFSAGRRTNGFGGGRLNEGHFSNDLFGAYILYAYSGCHTCVAMETADGIVAVNAETEEETEKIYSSILEAWSRFQKK